MNSRPAWSTYRIPGQPELQRETLSLKGRWGKGKTDSRQTDSLGIYLIVTRMLDQIDTKVKEELLIRRLKAVQDKL